MTDRRRLALALGAAGTLLVIAVLATATLAGSHPRASVLAPREKREIPADADDFRRGIERGSKILDDCRPESHRALLEFDIGLVGVA